jgi:hypothetical protein
MYQIYLAHSHYLIVTLFIYLLQFFIVTLKKHVPILRKCNLSLFNIFGKCNTHLR